MLSQAEGGGAAATKKLIDFSLTGKKWNPLEAGFSQNIAALRGLKIRRKD